jgi:4-hydroxy-tetrahydrodipicolinate reductase
MRIAIIGYGKMGKLIEELAVEQGHQVVLRINSQNKDQFTKEALQQSDVAIEFTTPHSAYRNVKTCIEFGVPVVSGSTGWNEYLPAAKAYCREKKGGFLHASNFSIGVTIFFEVNKQLAALMCRQADYDVTIKEIHHTQKRDAPSGTAVTIAGQIIERIGRKKRWVTEADSFPENLVIHSERTDDAPGTHQVLYSSPIDDIEIVHTAHNRRGFAAGAVAAAEFLAGKEGVFEMKDVLAL